MCYAMPLYCSLSHDLMKLTKSKGSREGNDGVGSLRTESRARPVTSRRLIDRAYSNSSIYPALQFDPRDAGAAMLFSRPRPAETNATSSQAATLLPRRCSDPSS
jgi:hypothetical protein